MAVATFLRSYGALYVVSILWGMYSASYGSTQMPTSPLVQILVSWGVATCLAMWTSLDARTRRCTPCFDLGTFVFFTWYITVPGYIIVTRGWRGVLIVTTTMITMFLAGIALMIVFDLARIIVAGLG